MVRDDSDIASVRCLAILQIASALKAIVAVGFTYAWLGLLPPCDMRPLVGFIAIVLICTGTSIYAGWTLAAFRGMSITMVILFVDWCLGGLALILSQHFGPFSVESFAAFGVLVTTIVLPLACTIAFTTLAAAIRRFTGTLCRSREI